MIEHNELIKLLTPKIKSVLSQTNYQDREDLEQQLKMVVIEKSKKINFNGELDFFDMLKTERERERSRKFNL